MSLRRGAFGVKRWAKSGAPAGGTLSLFPSATGVTVINGFDRPEDAAASWESTITRKVMAGQVTGFCLHTATPGDLATATATILAMSGNAATAPGIVQRLCPITTVAKSYSTATLGTYYDPIVPLTTDNASTAEYLWIDITCDGTTQVKIGDCTINLTYHGSVPTNPAIPLQIGGSNYAMILGYNGAYASDEALGIYPLDMLIDHRMTPYNWRTVAWNGTDTSDFVTNTPAASNGPIMADFATFPVDKAGSYSRSTLLTKLGNAATTMDTHGCATGAWLYTMDEPSGAHLADYQAEFAAVKAAYPDIRLMVTTGYVADYDIDIFCDVAVNIGTGKQTVPATVAAAGKTLWMYISCMSHGCWLARGYSTDSYYNDESVLDNPEGSDSGEPDLMIDRTAAEAFGFYLVGYFHGVEALLYFNSVEIWPCWSANRDPDPIDVWTDIYTFGGNGDGTLLYPGGAQTGNPMGQTKRPYPSVRLKLLREASYLADAMKADSSQSWVQTQVAGLVTSSTVWDKTMANIVTFRNALLDRK